MNKIELSNTSQLETQIASIFDGEVSVCNGCLLMYKDDTLCIDAYLNAYYSSPDEADRALIETVIQHAKQTLEILKQHSARLAESLQNKQVIYRCVYMDWMKAVNVAIEANGETVIFERD